MAQKLVYTDPYPGRDGNEAEWDPCGRCAGTGYVPSNVDGGICYDCRGRKGQMVTIRTLRARESSRISRENKREAEYQKRLDRHEANEARVAEHTDHADKWLDLCSERGGAFLMDIWSKAFDYELSDKQVAAVANSINRHFEREAAREAEKAEMTEAPVGKTEIDGIIELVKERETEWGIAFKMIVRDERNFKVWSTIPKKVIDQFAEEIGDEYNVYGKLEELKGRHVRFTAKLTASDEKTFAFASSPSKAQLV